MSVSSSSSVVVVVVVPVCDVVWMTFPEKMKKTWLMKKEWHEVRNGFYPLTTIHSRQKQML